MPQAYLPPLPPSNVQRSEEDDAPAVLMAPGTILKLRDLGCAPYVLYGVKYIDPVSLPF